MEASPLLNVKRNSVYKLYSFNSEPIPRYQWQNKSHLNHLYAGSLVHRKMAKLNLGTSMLHPLRGIPEYSCPIPVDFHS